MSFLNFYILLKKEQILIAIFFYLRHISEVIDVSSYSSYISVIHGTTGEYLVNRTNSVTSVFTQLRNFTGNRKKNSNEDEIESFQYSLFLITAPSQLSLSNSFSSIVSRLSNQTLQESEQRLIGATSSVILTISQGNRITETDFQSAKRLLNGSMRQFPDLYFAFVTNAQDTFLELTNNHVNWDNLVGGNLRDLAQSEEFAIIKSIEKDPSRFSGDLTQVLKTIPQRIFNGWCSNPNSNEPRRDEFEQYISPDVELTYRIHPTFLQQANEVKIHFVGFDYGAFTVCMSRGVKQTMTDCQTVDTEDVTFTIQRPCDNTVNCKGIYFTVLMDNSKLRCTGKNKNISNEKKKFFVLQF